MTRPKAQYIFPSLAKRFLYILFTFCCNYLKIFATHGVSIESIELFSVACAQEKHYVLGKRPNNFCSSRKYSLANTLLKQKKKQGRTTTTKNSIELFCIMCLGNDKTKRRKKSSTFPDQGRN